MWQGDVNDRCLYCYDFLRKKEFAEKVEKEISSQFKIENDILYIRPHDTNLKKNGKRVAQLFRVIGNYLQIAFVAFITLLLWLISLFTA